jgi:hypothetical protein
MGGLLFVPLPMVINIFYLVISIGIYWIYICSYNNQINKKVPYGNTIKKNY